MVQDRQNLKHLFQGLLVCGVGCEASVDKAINSDINIKMLTDLAPTIIWTRGLDGQVTYLNSYWFEFTGMEEGNLAQTSINEFIHPDDIDEIMAVHRQGMETKQEYKIEFRLRRKDGQYRWFSATSRPVNNQEGEMVQWMGVAHIVEDLKQAKAALIAAEDHYRHAVELNPLTVWTSGTDGLFDYVSKRWIEWTGTTGLGTGWGDVTHPDDLQRTIDEWARCRREETPYDVIHRMRILSGEYHWMHSRAYPRYANGEVIKWYGTTEDINDRKEAEHRLAEIALTMEQKVIDRTRQLEEAQAQVLAEMDARQKTQDALRQAQKMESVGQLTGGIAHDFNNMLTVIIGNLELMKMSAPNLGDNPVAKRMERNVGMAIEAAIKAEKLTAQLLAFSRKARLQLERLDANNVVNGVKEMVDRAVGMNVECEIDLEEGLWLCLSDKTQLESAIINLAINARDAMPHGGKLIICTKNREINDSRYVSVAVRDSGTGMDEDTLSKACEPFFTTKDVGKGSGLGLSMVYGFAQQSNGKLDIKSKPGEGTTVEMLFPYTAGETIEVTQAEEDFNFDANKQSILVVDDEPGVRELACQLLGDAGFNVVSADNGRNAIKILQDSSIPIDLLFTDVVMPGGIDGFEVARVAHKERNGLPIIFTTGHAEVALKELQKDHTQKLKVIGKPYRLNELVQMIQSELQPR